MESKPFPQAWSPPAQDEQVDDPIQIPTERLLESRRQVEDAMHQAVNLTASDSMATCQSTLGNLESVTELAQKEVQALESQLAVMNMLRDAMASGLNGTLDPSEEDIQEFVRAVEIHAERENAARNMHAARQDSAFGATGRTNTASITGIASRQPQNAGYVVPPNRCPICTLPLPCKRHGRELPKASDLVAPPFDDKGPTVESMAGTPDAAIDALPAEKASSMSTATASSESQPKDNALV